MSLCVRVRMFSAVKHARAKRPLCRSKRFLLRRTAAAGLIRLIIAQIYVVSCSADIAALRVGN